MEDSPPTIVQGPQTDFVDIYSSTTLTCIVSGSPQPTIQWFKDDVILPDEVFSSYYIQSVQLDDRGVYHCEAKNRLGTTKSSPAVINIVGIQQYIVDLIIPINAFGVSSFDQAVVDQSKDLVTTVIIHVI